MITYQLIVVSACVIAVFSHLLVRNFWIACSIATLLPVVPIVMLGWHHVEHWYFEPLVFLSMAMTSSMLIGWLVRRQKSPEETSQ